MSKAVLLAISPKWCDLILSGKKTIEIRKSFPSGDVPFTVYLYKTKTGALRSDISAGKIVGAFVCSSSSCYDYVCEDSCEGNGYYRINDDELEATHIPYEDFTIYGGGDRLYGWKVTSVIKYSEPLSLDSFRKVGYISAINEALFESFDTIEERFKISRPPQSYMFVEPLAELILQRIMRQRNQ